MPTALPDPAASSTPHGETDPWPPNGRPGEEVRHAACPLCEASCGLVVRMAGDRIHEIRGDSADPLSRGHICPKGVALQDLQTDERWLRRPMRRTATGWEEMEWDAAIAWVAERLAEVQARHGKDALAVYLGNPNVHSFGAMTHVPSLLAALGTRNRYSAASVDQLPHQLVAWALFGHQYLLPVPDIDRCERLLLLGSNPMASNGSIWTVPDFPRRLRDLQRRGGRLTVLDPRLTETARVADEHHFIRPGTDVYLLLAMIRIILDRGLARPAAYLNGIAELQSLVEPFTPALAAARTGLAEDVIDGLAETVASSRAAIHGRTGLSTQSHGLLCQWAIQVLHAITGNLDTVGGAMFTRPAIDLAKPWITPPGSHGTFHSRVRHLPESAGELPVSTMADEMLTPGPGQVKALLTVAGNPVVSTPGGSRLAEAIENLDFVVAIDPYLNATTQLADVVLPPSKPFERDHYDLIFAALAVRNTARFTPALVPRPAEARHDWEIMRALIGALHTARGTRPSLAERAQFSQSPRRTLGLLLRFGGRRLSLRKLTRHPSGVDLGPLEPCLPRRLRTRGKKVNLVPDVIRGPLRELSHDRAAGTQNDTTDLLLIGRRHLKDNNSWLAGFPRLDRGAARHQLWINPSDADARGIADGSVVSVTSASGSFTTPCRLTPRMMAGVVSVPHGYGWTRPGASVNDATDPASVDPSGTAVLNGVPVTVTTALP